MNLPPEQLQEVAQLADALAFEVLVAARTSKRHHYVEGVNDIVETAQKIRAITNGNCVHPQEKQR